MGRVYLARQVDLGRQVVVKVMHDHIAADPQVPRALPARNAADGPLPAPLRRHALRRLAQRPARAVHRHGVHQRRDPRRAAARATAGSTPARVGRLLGQLCEVLQAAHTEGIIHRDLKPANLMVVDPDTPYEQIKVMDFGLAKLVEAADAARRSPTTQRRLRRRHARLHLPGAGPRRGDGPPRRPVHRRRHPVRAADRPAAVRRPLHHGRAAGPRHRAAAVVHRDRRQRLDLPGASKRWCAPAWPRTRRTGRRAPASWRNATRTPCRSKRPRSGPRAAPATHRPARRRAGRRRGHAAAVGTDRPQRDHASPGSVDAGEDRHLQAARLRPRRRRRGDRKRPWPDPGAAWAAAAPSSAFPPASSPGSASPAPATSRWNCACTSPTRRATRSTSP